VGHTGTMTRSGSTQRWWQGGRVYPRFVDSRTTHRSDWEDFQVHRKTLGVCSFHTAHTAHTAHIVHRTHRTH
jgi:hypothetical protein